jgi:hypothetical protein
VYRRQERVRAFDHAPARQHADPERVGSRRVGHLVVALVDEPPGPGQPAGDDGKEQVKPLAFLPAPVDHPVSPQEVLPVQVPDLEDGVVPLRIGSQLLQFAHRFGKPPEVAFLG